MTRALRALAVTGLTLIATFGTGTVTVASADSAPVPEPSSLILLATGGAGLAWWLRTRRK